MNAEFLKWIDLLGTIAFAVSGALAALEKKLDLFGIFIIAFITALGGGTLRDILIGSVPVGWMHRPEYGAIVFFTAVVVVVFTKAINNFKNTLLLFDSLGLGLFTILGLQKGIALGLHPGMCIALGTITACFGGVIRDTLLNNIPLIFHNEIYATACILGGIVYFSLLNTDLHQIPSDVVSIAVIVLVRLIAVKNNWSLPRLNQHPKS